jgi:hypothetical protein
MLVSHARRSQAMVMMDPAHYCPGVAPRLLGPFGRMALARANHPQRLIPFPTAWMVGLDTQPSDLVRALAPLGEVRSDHAVRLLLIGLIADLSLPHFSGYLKL